MFSRWNPPNCLGFVLTFGRSFNLSSFAIEIQSPQSCIFAFTTVPGFHSLGNAHVMQWGCECFIACGLQLWGIGIRVIINYCYCTQTDGTRLGRSTKRWSMRKANLRGHCWVVRISDNFSDFVFMMIVVVQLRPWSNSPEIEGGGLLQKSKFLGFILNFYVTVGSIGLDRVFVVAIWVFFHSTLLQFFHNFCS